MQEELSELKQKVSSYSILNIFEKISWSFKDPAWVLFLKFSENSFVENSMELCWKTFVCKRGQMRF